MSNDDVAVSIFVNPTQFGPREDFTRYPRTLAADLDLLAPHGVRWVYAPEAAAGGPLAVVRNGDMIELDVPNRRLHLDISDAELKKRLADWKAPEPPLKSGYWKLYIDHVLQADEGADLDFLVGQRGAFVPKDNH